jgi:hypothetical protein
LRKPMVCGNAPLQIPGSNRLSCASRRRKSHREAAAAEMQIT